MNSEQLTFFDNQAQADFNAAFDLLKSGKFKESLSSFEPIFAKNPDFPGLAEGYKIARFWDNRRDEFNKRTQGKEKARLIMNEIERFKIFAEKNKLLHTEAYKYSIKYIYKLVIDNLLPANKEDIADPNLLTDLSICFIKTDEYQKARETLEYLLTFWKNNAFALALLGEALYHIGDEKNSKIHFKEAFLRDPDRVDIEMLKADIISETIKKMHEENVNKKLLKEYLPIYATINGFFNERRNISKSEKQYLAESLIRFEKLYKIEEKRQEIKPRILNFYIWLLEYYTFQVYDNEMINAIFERLEEIDPILKKRIIERVNIR